MAPGAKFSTKTSARRARSLTRASPRSDLRFAVTDFLLALNSKKYQESRPGAPRNDFRPGSPPFGFSTLTTSAPSQASASVHEGPASNCVRSSTRTPARHLRGALFSVIGIRSSRVAAKSHDSAGDTQMASNQPSVFIDGEAGTTGLGIRKLLEMVSEVVLRKLPEGQRTDPSSRQDMMASCALVR